MRERGMNKSRILLVEDEADIRRFVRIALEKADLKGYEATTAKQARLELANRKFDLIIVDLGLPDGDGKALIREVRTSSGTPVIVLSARDQQAEKVEALDAGADDYMVKPFGVPELLARVRAQLRRASAVSNAGPSSSIVRFGKVSVDFASHEVLRNGECVHLTPIEFRVLRALIQANGSVLTHQQLLKDVWGARSSDRTNYIRIYMAQLRQKLEDDPAQPRHLITELQVGYRLSGLEFQARPPQAAMGE
jgi:two-component system KDP operon response regulator KdpE